MAEQSWQRVVASERAILRGANWWHIEMSCGHSAMVLYGPNDPLWADVKCRYRCEEPQSVDAVDPVDGVTTK